MSKETKREIIIGAIALILVIILFVFACPKMGNKTNKIDYVGTVGISNKNCLNDYTWYELSEVSADIADKGGASGYFEIFARYADEGQTKTVELLNGDKVEFRIIGIKHDTLASDQSKQAGLTFMAQNALKDPEKLTNTINPCNWNTGTLRARMQDGGDIFTLFPEELTKNIKTVVKNSISNPSTLITTNDQFFIPSNVELIGKTDINQLADGKKYEYINNDSFGILSAGISCINHTGFEELKKNSSVCDDPNEAFAYVHGKSGSVNSKDYFLTRSIEQKFNETFSCTLDIMNYVWTYRQDADCPIVLCFCI